MADFQDSMGGLVVNTSGGNAVTGGFFGKVKDGICGNGYLFWGIMIVGIIIILALAFGWGLSGYRSGYEDVPGRRYGTGGAAMRFAGAPSDNVSHFTQERDADYAAQVSDGFINSREQPYFPDVTNRVLRMENREKEAVRALGKINQERLRRAAEDTSSTTPLPWGPFWKEWKSTHPMEGEDVSGFEDDEGGYAAGFSLPY